MQIVQRLVEDVAVLELKGTLDYGTDNRELDKVIADLADRGFARVV